MTDQHVIADGLGALAAQLDQEASDPALSEPARSALLELISLLNQQQSSLRHDPTAFAHEVVRLVRSHPAAAIEGLRCLRVWSEQKQYASQEASSREPSGYVKSEAPGAAFLESDLADGGNLSAVSGSSSVAQSEDVDSKHLAPG
jgi:hypothetical protein